MKRFLISMIFLIASAPSAGDIFGQSTLAHVDIEFFHAIAEKAAELARTETEDLTLGLGQRDQAMGIASNAQKIQMLCDRLGDHKKIQENFGFLMKETMKHELLYLETSSLYTNLITFAKQAAETLSDPERPQMNEHIRHYWGNLIAQEIAAHEQRLRALRNEQQAVGYSGEYEYGLMF